MRKIKFRLRNNMYPILWSIILLLSIYILIRLVILSFSEDMGQAGFKEALAAKFCNILIESGSKLIAYTSEDTEERYSFPISFADHEIAVQRFLESSDTVTARSGEEAAYYALDDTHLKAEEVSGSNILGGADTKALSQETELEIYEINSSSLGLEYLLTNGAVLQSLTSNILLGDEKLIDGQLKIGYLEGNISQGDITESIETGSEMVETLTNTETVDYTLEQLKNISFLIRNFYTVDASTKITETLFDADELLNKDMTMKQGNDAPQILIYHTHSQEAYADSRPGKVEDTVIGAGEYLAGILEEDYGYNVIHDTTTYDTLDAEKGHKAAYTEALKGLTKILEDNPTIEVMIDLHRNSGEAKTTMLGGKETAQIMLFNGLCRDQNGPMVALDNPYLQDNLALSFQLQIKSREIYPGLFIKNYLKSYRYNMHLRPKSMLVELGTYKNTVESAMNAMVPFAKILDDVLQGD